MSLPLDLIMFGAFTRLTDSGLGCPDWPGCYGQSTPLEAHEDIAAAELADPYGPVTVVKAWIEMLHRYFAMGIGVLIMAIMVIAWRRWLQSGRQNHRFSPTFPTMLFLFVCLQGAFGAWTVTMLLQPFIAMRFAFSISTMRMNSEINSRFRLFSKYFSEMASIF